MPDTAVRPAPPIPARLWAVAAVTGAGAFMAMLDSTVANLAVESIRADFGADLARIQWIVTGYLIALVVSLPATAWLGSRFGNGRTWSVSMALFVGASALCGLASGPGSLVGARLLQGLAAGVMIPAGQAVIGAAAGPAQLGRIFGALGLVIALGPAIGPPIGGVLIEMASWRWLFWINVPIGIAALLAARRLVPAGDVSRARPLDGRGLVLLGTGLPLTLYGAGGWSEGSAGPGHLLSLVAGIALTAGFVLSARRAPTPLIELRLLRERGFAAAALTAALTGANMYGGLLLIPLFFQIVRGRSVAETGTLLFVMGLGSALALPVAGRFTDGYGPRAVSLAGASLLVLSLGPFLLPGTVPAALMTGALFVRGIAQAWAQMPAMTAAYAATRPERMADAATLVNILQRLGGALGVIVVAVILARAGEGTAGQAHAVAFGVLLAISLVTVGAAGVMQGRR